MGSPHHATSPAPAGSALRRGQPATDRRAALVGAAAVACFCLLGLVRIVGAGPGAVISYPDGPGVDLVLHLWQYGWVRHALATSDAVFRNSVLVAPAELDMLGLWEGHLDLLVGVPWVGALGVAGAASVTAAVFLLTCGLGVYVLCERFCGDPLAAAAAGMLYVVYPPVLNEALHGRVEELCGGLLALAVAGLVGWWRRGRPADLALGAVSLGLCVGTYLGAVLFVALLFPSLLLGERVARGALGWSPQGLGRWPRRAVVAIGGLLAALAIWSVAWGLRGPGGVWALTPWMGSEGLFGTVTEDWLAMSDHGRMPLALMFSPLPAGRPLGSGVALPLVAAVGVLAGIGSIRRAAPWLIGAVVLHVLALGPTLSEVAVDGGLPAPFRLLPWILPFSSRFYWPYRLLLPAGICLAVLASFGLRQLFGLLPRRALRPLVALGAVALGCAQVARSFPLPTLTLPAAPAAYRELDRLGARAIFDLSSQHDPGVTHPLLAQLEHGHPFCCQDFLPSLFNEQMRALAAEYPARTFLAGVARHKSPTAANPPPAAEFARLADLGFTHAVIQQPTLPGMAECKPGDGRWDFALRSWLGDPLVYACEAGIATAIHGIPAVPRGGGEAP